MQKSHAVFTNVPGPREELYLAGKPVKAYIPFIPQPGAGGLGLGILTYNNKVAMTIVADSNLVENCNFLSYCFEEEIKIMKESAEEHLKKCNSQKQDDYYSVAKHQLRRWFMRPCKGRF